MNEAHPKRTPRPWSKKAPMQGPWDAIVIGSGIGGMTTAAVLATFGHRVLVLEQHYVPGGYTHTFRRKGYEWDVGVHLVGGTSEVTITGRILAALTQRKLKWQDVGEIYDTFFFPGKTIAFPNHPTKFRAMLLEHFPGQESVIDGYFQAVRDATKAMRGYYLRRALPSGLADWMGAVAVPETEATLMVSAATVLEDLVPDEKLRAVLLAQWGYHGSVPSEVSWGMQAAVVAHFLYGATYPVGGAKNIALHMLQTVADHGGWTRICANVTDILVEKGRAVGVRMEDGEEIRATRVISAAGAHTTFAKLLPEALRDKDWSRRVRTHKSSAAHVCLYLGFKGDIEAAGATASSQWFYDTWSHENAVWPLEVGKPVQRPKIVFTSFPSLKDPEHEPGPDQRHTGEMITFVDYDVFQRWKGTAWRKRGADYEAFKAELTDKLLEVLFEHRPELAAMIDHAELATPLSSELFAAPYRGSIYGLTHSPERFGDPWLRTRTPVPGLFLSGSDVSSGGVMGALVGGLLCALSIEPIRTVRWVAGLTRP